MTSSPYLTSPAGRTELAAVYRNALLNDVVPFWLRHGIDKEFGGFLTALGRDGTVIDTDKSIWFQGRGAWTFASLYLEVEKRAEWLEAARSGIEFLRRFGVSPGGKMYFTVTREGKPLRMRRYVYSESFAAIANAAYARAAGDERSAADAQVCLAGYLHASFTPGAMEGKVSADTRPMMGIAPLLIAIFTAQEVRQHLGDIACCGRTCSEWIDWCIDRIERYFLKPDLAAMMDVVGPGGEIIDHFDGRMLAPGDAMEGGWFILREGQRRNDRRLIQIGLNMIDWMWKRGWDEEFGGLYNFRDLYNHPIQEYTQDMKFWWTHCEAIIATVMAWQLTGDARYAEWHRQVHDWTFAHFPDKAQGEWFGYLHRDGRVSTQLKGNMWKGPFHIPRMLRMCWQMLEPKKGTCV
ncbi:MAG TPA: AGE family epimerase/isomerase [Tepidisphaeraceae bacterium]|jgi:N-acylglucosamine 2-epimerase|nr:AGE family epimerase/isomerase [Tepidisphaeraceae bacterium]